MLTSTTLATLVLLRDKHEASSSETHPSSSYPNPPSSHYHDSSNNPTNLDLFTGSRPKRLPRIFEILVGEIEDTGMVQGLRPRRDRHSKNGNLSEIPLIYKRPPKPSRSKSTKRSKRKGGGEDRGDLNNQNNDSSGWLWIHNKHTHRMNTINEEWEGALRWIAGWGLGNKQTSTTNESSSYSSSEKRRKRQRSSSSSRHHKEITLSDKATLVDDRTADTISAMLNVCVEECMKTDKKDSKKKRGNHDQDKASFGVRLQMYSNHNFQLNQWGGDKSSLLAGIAHVVMFGSIWGIPFLFYYQAFLVLVLLTTIFVFFIYPYKNQLLGLFKNKSNQISYWLDIVGENEESSSSSNQDKNNKHASHSTSTSHHPQHHHQQRHGKKGKKKKQYVHDDHNSHNNNNNFHHRQKTNSSTKIITKDNDFHESSTNHVTQLENVPEEDSFRIKSFELDNNDNDDDIVCETQHDEASQEQQESNHSSPALATVNSISVSLNSTLQLHEMNGADKNWRVIEKTPTKAPSTTQDDPFTLSTSSDNDADAVKGKPIPLSSQQQQHLNQDQSVTAHTYDSKAASHSSSYLHISKTSKKSPNESHSSSSSLRQQQPPPSKQHHSPKSKQHHPQSHFMTTKEKYAPSSLKQKQMASTATTTTLSVRGSSSKQELQQQKHFSVPTDQQREEASRQLLEFQMLQVSKLIQQKTKNGVIGGGTSSADSSLSTPLFQRRSRNNTTSDVDCTTNTNGRNSLLEDWTSGKNILISPSSDATTASQHHFSLFREDVPFHHQDDNEPMSIRGDSIGGGRGTMESTSLFDFPGEHLSGDELLLSNMLDEDEEEDEGGDLGNNDMKHTYPSNDNNSNHQQQSEDTLPSFNISTMSTDVIGPLGFSRTVMGTNSVSLGYSSFMMGTTTNNHIKDGAVVGNNNSSNGNNGGIGVDTSDWSTSSSVAAATASSYSWVSSTTAGGECCDNSVNNTLDAGNVWS